MKKVLVIFVLILVCSILNSNTIEETQSQIESIKKEIEQTEIIVKEKINDLKINDPLFSEKDVFETEEDYFQRRNRANNNIEEIREIYLGSLFNKLKSLRQKILTSSEVIIKLDKKKYNTELNEWIIEVQIKKYKLDDLIIKMNISQKDARDLFDNWDKVLKKAILSFDPFDEIMLIGIQISNPITGFEFKYPLYLYKEFTIKGGASDIALSHDAKYIAFPFYQGGYNNYVKFYNLKNNKLIKKLIYRAYPPIEKVAFSRNCNLLAILNSEKIIIYNISEDTIIKEFEHNFRLYLYYSFSFNKTGDFILIGDSNRIKIFDTETGYTFQDIELNIRNLNPECIFFNDINTIIGIQNNILSGEGKINIYDLKNKKLIGTFDKKYSEGWYGYPFKDFYYDIKEDALIGLGMRGAGFNGFKACSFSSNNSKEEISYLFDTIYNSSFTFDGSYFAVLAGIVTPETNQIKEFYVNVYRNPEKYNKETINHEYILSPPSLTAILNFIEPSGDNYLNALENGKINLTIKNTGEGPAKGINVKIIPERINGLNYNNTYVEEIKPGERITKEIPIEAYIGLEDGDHTFRFEFDEINGFPPDPVEIQISTKSYVKPVLFIADVGIEDSNGDGKIQSGEMVNLTIRFANKGKGLSSGTYAKFYMGNDVYLTEKYPKTVKLGEIDYAEFVDVPVEFFVNDRTVEEIPLYVDITESTNLANVEKLRVPILKSDRTKKVQKTVIAGIDKEYGDMDFGDDLSIDIEAEIPNNNLENHNTLAVIFGIEDYKNVSPVSYAHRDARFMKEYFNKTLGIPENNIYYKTNEDVGKAEFDKVFSKDGWLDKRVKDGKTEIYFYYAGHGSPDIKQNKAYLIPYDGDPNYASQTGYEVEKIYSNLANLKAKNVTVFLDACFSGANRENEMLLADARPITIEVDSPIAYGITVFSAASSKEISSAWPDMKHGLFSYFLMKGLQGNADENSDGDLTIKELGDYIQSNVSMQAGYLDREQTPSVISDDYYRVLINF